MADEKKYGEQAIYGSKKDWETVGDICDNAPEGELAAWLVEAFGGRGAVESDEDN